MYACFNIYLYICFRFGMRVLVDRSIDRSMAGEVNDCLFCFERRTIAWSSNECKELCVWFFSFLSLSFF